MNIAITGATGFIGSYLVQKLKTSKHKITLFDSEKHSLFDVQSLKAFVSKQDAVIHLAGIKNSVNPYEIYRINLLGTANLLTAIEIYGKKNCHFLFASTFLVYNENSRNAPLTENNPVNPQGTYGISKLLAEELIRIFCEKKIIKATTLRIANVYGPDKNNKSLSVPNLFIQGIKNKQAVLIKGNGNLSRDFIYLGDVVKAFEKAILFQKKKFLILNICTGKATKIIDLLHLVEENLQKKAKVKYDHNYKEQTYWIGNPNLAKKEINFKPETDLPTGLKLTLSP